jgi:hypothetical protein
MLNQGDLIQWCAQTLSWCTGLGDGSLDAKKAVINEWVDEFMAAQEPEVCAPCSLCMRDDGCTQRTALKLARMQW